MKINVKKYEAKEKEKEIVTNLFIDISDDRTDLDEARDILTIVLRNENGDVENYIGTFFLDEGRISMRLTGYVNSGYFNTAGENDRIKLTEDGY